MRPAVFALGLDQRQPRQLNGAADILGLLSDGRPRRRNRLGKAVVGQLLQGDLEGSTALLRKVIAQGPLQGWWYRALGQVQMAQGHYEEALENFMTARRLTDQNDPVFDTSLAYGLDCAD